MVMQAVSSVLRPLLFGDRLVGTVYSLYSADESIRKPGSLSDNNAWMKNADSQLGASTSGMKSNF